MLYLVGFTSATYSRILSFFTRSLHFCLSPQLSLSTIRDDTFREVLLGIQLDYFCLNRYPPSRFLTKCWIVLSVSPDSVSTPAVILSSALIGPTPCGVPIEKAKCQTKRSLIWANRQRGRTSQDYISFFESHDTRDVFDELRDPIQHQPSRIGLFCFTIDL